MDLFRLKSSLAWTVLLTGAMTLAACGDKEEQTPKDNGVAGDTDGGVEEDSGQNTGMDATASDRGGRADTGVPRDTGVSDPCVVGTEGCDCTRTSTAVVPFRQENCEAGLLCTPWSLVNDGETWTGDLNSCLKPCTQDGDCGNGRHCSETFFNQATGLARFCVDEVAENDEFCSGSKQSKSVHPNAQVQDEVQKIRWCEAGAECVLGVFALTADEGICLTTCQADTDCPTGYPYCNPRFFTSSSTVTPTIGVCSHQKRPRGALCGVGPNADPDKLGLTDICDTSVETCGPDLQACPDCIRWSINGAAGNQEILPENNGICSTRCDATHPCPNNLRCEPNQFGMDPKGLCVDDCTEAPENCDLPGTQNAGMSCFGNFCIDRYPPALTPASWNAAGVQQAAGENCFGDLDNHSFLRCPEGYTCLNSAANEGPCVPLCDPAGSPNVCNDILNVTTATCTAAQQQVDVCGNG